MKLFFWFQRERERERRSEGGERQNKTRKKRKWLTYKKACHKLVVEWMKLSIVHWTRIVWLDPRRGG